MAGRRSSFDLSKRPLHTALVERGARGRGPVALVAERGGTPAAMLYGFRWRDTFAYYQSGWEPELARLSIGTVLVAQAIGFAAADGARVFDFLRGAESYKYRFGALDRYDETWLLPHGAGGALLALRHRVHGALMARREAHSPSRSPVVGAGMDTVAKGER